MTVVATISPDFDTAAAETGYDRLVEQHPHVAEIASRIYRRTRADADLSYGRYREKSDLIESRDEQLRAIGFFEHDLARLGRRTEADEKQLEKMNEKLRKIKARIEEIAGFKPESFYHFDTIRKFCAKLTPLSRFAAVTMDVPADADTAFREVETIRQRRVDLRRKRTDIELGPLPLADALAKAKVQIAKLVRDGAPNTSALFRMPEDLAGNRHQGSIRFKEHVPPGSRDYYPNPWPFIFWAAEEAIMSKIEAKLRAEAGNHADPISWIDRAPLLADIDAELKALEYRESALVNLLQSGSSFNVDYRHDTNPMAVLLLERLPDAEKPEEPEPYYPVVSGGASLGVKTSGEGGWTFPQK